MKLEKYVDKSTKRRKTVLISISVIVLISISFLLYKTFASFTESAEFPMMKGQVDYFGNSDIYLAFYNGKDKLEEMPLKDNQENLVFDYGECDNGASIIWDSEAWAPLVKNLSKSKTKCRLYFRKSSGIEYLKELATTSNNLAYDGKKILGDLGTNDNNLRFIGSNPNNYVKFNDEIWRIIGVMKITTERKTIEERIKIIRTRDIDNQTDIIGIRWDKGNHNDWVLGSLKNMLNSIYYNSASGECYTTDSKTPATCDFTEESGNPKGLNEAARNMIDKDIIWNIGGLNNRSVSTNIMYEAERGELTSHSSYLNIWTKENDPEYHNGIGLMYPSDYGYAVGGDVRNTCLPKKMYDEERNDYRSDNCKNNNWLKPSSGYYWTLTPNTESVNRAMMISSDGYLGNSFCMNYVGTVIAPVVYLKSSIEIVSNSASNYGSIDNPFILK